MRSAAKSLVGLHDFRGYSQELDASVTNTHREVLSIDVSEFDDEIWIDVRGNAFVKGMMRRIGGMLLEVGLGKRPVKEAALLLSERGRAELQWPEVLPARGLTLMEVVYDNPPRDFRGRHDEKFEYDE